MAERNHKPNLVALFTDFGMDGLYTGQLQIALAHLPLPVVNLLSDAPVFDARASAYLLSALVKYQPPGAVFLSVVDPGVGGSRHPLLIKTDDHWFVGPDNGLFSQVIKASSSVEIGVIDWRPPDVSRSFHGRDLFAPVVAKLTRGECVATRPMTPSGLVGAEWDDDLNTVIYADHYGNLITGIRAKALPLDAVLVINGTQVSYAETFSKVAENQPFWYRNSIGLIEIAANKNSAQALLQAAVGMSVVPDSG